jgi:Fur family ferric uptake transcriptional regulator
LRGRNLQWTPQRDSIFQEVLQTQGHFDAEELSDRLKAKAKRVSRATVYRTLPHLQESGLIQEVLRIEGRAQYERRAGHHDHMLCVRCGRIIEFRQEAIERLQNKVCRSYGFKPLEHRMGIRGICKECREKSEGKSNDDLD